ncbi:unnamed protein product [Microthlaspi erraticum]|uniref:Uncharacterized protein n=1 Tax=Microthlaspi erraticum TaxID=1685480 RepID=A0A6D2K0N6_9BRAS|nr:unnamed protein product [Microthlaspi erraticum]
MILILLKHIFSDGRGADRAIGRDIVDPHYKECLYTGIGVSCVEGEVMPGQWELQVYMWRVFVLVIQYVLLDAFSRVTSWNRVPSSIEFRVELK